MGVCVPNPQIGDLQKEVKIEPNKSSRTGIFVPVPLLPSQMKEPKEKKQDKDNRTKRNKIKKQRIRRICKIKIYMNLN